MKEVITNWNKVLLYISIIIIGSLTLGVGAIMAFPSSIHSGNSAAQEEAVAVDSPIPTDSIVTPIPSVEIVPTVDPDPIITCNSKTGQLQVKQSVCNSYTDCPDGYGEYVFESQDSCKTRWDKISQNAANLMSQTAQAHIDLYNTQNAINQSVPYPSMPVIAVPDPVQFNSSINVKIVDPTPIPTQAFGGGSLGGSINH